MRILFPGLALMAGCFLAGCANNPNRPTDIGSMQTPQLPAQTGFQFSPDTLGNMGSMQIRNGQMGNLRTR